MPDDLNQPPGPPSGPSPGPHLEGERRQEQDRRLMGRQGKYDRRRNRCVHCVHFQEENHSGKGQCLRHDMSVVAYAFACPNFEPLAPPKA